MPHLARERGPDLSTIGRTFVDVDQLERPAHRPETRMHLYAVDTAFQLADDRREQLLRQVARRRRLRRRPPRTVLPGSPPDAA
jgi:hypothetical protein